MGNRISISHFFHHLKLFLILGKFRLSLLVIYSSLLSYFIGASGLWDWTTLLGLTFGGLFITFSANAFNQIIERERDALMKRTQNRPLPTRQLSIGEATVFALLMALFGFHFLSHYVTPYAGILGMLSFFIYVLLYTPMKLKSSFAVWVGAIPGALPVLIGYYAATHQIDSMALLLFGIQFFWQFPHFWIIAWLGYEDYQKAGYYLLPFTGGKNFSNALAILFSHIPLLLFPYFMFKLHYLSFSSALSIAVIAFLPVIYCLQFLSQFLSGKGIVKKIMIWNFIYLLIVFPIILID